MQVSLCDLDRVVLGDCGCKNISSLILDLILYNFFCIILTLIYFQYLRCSFVVASVCVCLTVYSEEFPHSRVYRRENLGIPSKCILKSTLI